MKDIFALRLYTRVARLGGFQPRLGQSELFNEAEMIARVQQQFGRLNSSLRPVE
jgi:hypothetical protein